jgi:hypothetical protein
MADVIDPARQETGDDPWSQLGADPVEPSPWDFEVSLPEPAQVSGWRVKFRRSGAGKAMRGTLWIGLAQRGVTAGKGRVARHQAGREMNVQALGLRGGVEREGLFRLVHFVAVGVGPVGRPLDGACLSG